MTICQPTRARFHAFVALLAFASLLLPVGCQSTASAEQQTATPPPHDDTMDASSPTDRAPTDQAPADQAANENQASEGTGTKPPGIADMRDPQTFIFNRVIVKFVDADVSDAELIKMVESHTGEKVESVHRGPIQTGVIIFAPVTPARDGAAQTTLAKTLADNKAFVYAEPDRLRGPR